MIGKQLEAAWGAFRFNCIFFSGMLFIVLEELYWHIYADRHCVTNGYMVSESIVILCICSTVSRYPAVIVFRYSDQDQMAGDLMACILYAIVQAFLPATAEVIMVYIIRRMRLQHLSQY